MCKKVLLIESNSLVREFLKEYLRLFGYECEITTSTVLSLSDYNFIIADYTTIKELNLVEYVSKIVFRKPVIITSTMNCPEEEILKKYALCLVKPFSLEEFKDILKNVDEEFHTAV